MATKWTSPVWRIPEESNQSKFENYSLDFDGSSQYIDLGTSIPPRFSSTGNGNTEPWTVSLWANCATSTSESLIQFPFGAGVYTWYMFFFGGKISFGHRYGSVLCTETNSGAAINNQWNNIVVTFDGVDIADISSFKLYINGVDIPITTRNHFGTNNTNVINIGRGFTSAYYEGKITETLFYDSALSATQITALYNSGTPVNPMALTPLPVAYYPLGGSSTGSSSTLTTPNESIPSATVFDFDGSDKILTKTLTEFGISNEFTVSTWIKPSSLTNYGLVLVATSGSNWTDGMGIYYLSNKWHFFVDHYSSGDVISTTTATTDVWYNIVGTFSSSGTVKLYINGVEEGTPVTGVTLDGLSETLTLGSININGLYSNTQIWNKELVSSEVTTLYNNGVPLFSGTQPQASNLKGWWKMNVDTSNWDGSDWTIGSSTANYTSALNFGDRTQLKRVNVPLAAVNVTNAITVSSWIKTQKNNATRQSIISNYNSTLTANKAWGLQIGAAWGSGYTKANFFFYNDTASTVFSLDQSSSQILTDNNWHNVVAVWDGTTTANAVKIFVDGLLAGQGTSTFAGPIKTALNSQPAIGEYARDVSGVYGGGNLFGGDAGEDGFMSNIQVWDTTLTYGSISSIGDVATGQIAELYNNGTPLTTAIASSNMKSWYKLDNLTTGIQDSSGNSNNGTNLSTSQASSFVSTLNGLSNGMNTANLVTSDLTRSIPYSSYSMQLDGTADFINCGNAFTQTGAFSVSAWIKTSTTGATSVLYKSGVFQFGKDTWYNGGVGGAPNLSLTDSGGITKLFRNGVAPSGATVTVGTVVDLKDGNWHHIAFTYNGTNQGKYYTDGIMSYTYDITDGSWAGTLASNSNDLLIGKTTVANWNGNISNASFFSSSLTEDQILTIYNGGVPNSISSLSPVSWWSLAGDSYFNGNDWICPDLGSGGNNGTSANMAGTELVGDGPGSTANGIATSMDIPANLKGNAPNSSKNAFSVNMNSADRVADVPA